MIKRLVHILEQVVLHGIHHVRTASSQLEDLLHHSDLRGGRVHAAERGPVVRHHTSADHVRTTVHRARHERDLQQRRQLLLLLHRRVWMHQASLVREHAVASHQRISGDRLPEHFHAQHVRYDLLRLLLLTLFVCRKRGPDRYGAEPRGRCRQSDFPERIISRPHAAPQPHQEESCECAAARYLR